MKNLIILISFSSMSIAALAQGPTLDWAFATGTGGAGVDVQRTSDGFLYWIGTFEGSVDFDPGPDSYELTSNGMTDIFILKLDTNGNFIWVKQIGNAGPDGTNSLGPPFAYPQPMGLNLHLIDAEQKLLILGTFQDSVDFDPGPGTYYMDGSTVPEYTRSVFMLTLDSNGDFISAITTSIGSTLLWSTMDTEENVVLLGSFHGTSDFDPSSSDQYLLNVEAEFLEYYIQKLTKSGGLIWAVGCGKEILGSRIECDSENNILFAGRYVDTADFDFGAGIYPAIASEDSLNNFLIKLGGNGGLMWFRHFTTFASGSFIRTAVDSDNNVYYTVMFRASVDADPGPLVYPLIGPSSSSAFLVKLDAAGEFLWANAFSGPTTTGVGPAMYIQSIEVFESNVLLSGHFHDSIDFDPGPDEYYMTNNSSGFVLKMNTSGEFIWAQSLGNNVNEVWRTTYDGHALYLTGFDFQSFDPDPGPGVQVLERGAYILKCIDPGLVTAMEPPVDGAGLNVFPNPTWDDVNLRIEGRSFDSFELYDSHGRLLKSQQISEDTTKRVKIPESSGIYLLRVMGSMGVETVKIIKSN